jgi:hypothetical protein
MIIFGPSSQRMKEQDWFLEALHFQQTSPSVLKRSVNMCITAVLPLEVLKNQNKPDFCKMNLEYTTITTTA